MDVINSPPLSAVDSVNAEGNPADVTSEWRAFFQSVYIICFAVQQSGTTANRPTKLLWAGRPYMDLTLNKPIWYTVGGWRDATGAIV